MRILISPRNKKIFLIVTILIIGGISFNVKLHYDRYYIYSADYWSNVILDGAVSNWETYKNEKFGYEIKYPQIDILIKDDGGCASDKDIIFYEEKNKGKWGKYTFMWMRPMWFPSNVEVDLNESLENLLKKKYSLKKLSIGIQKKETAAGELDYVEKIVIGENISAYKVHILAKYNLGICEYFAKYGNKAIEISRIKPNLTYTSCDEDMLFNQMLSTFKFTD